jgi:hypothetical protein
MKRISRRIVLRGLGGVALALPLLESIRPKGAKAADPNEQPFAIFMRQACGVACALTSEVGDEPERFWPANYGALTEANVTGKALFELKDHLPNLLVVRNVNMNNFDFGDGHARGALQGLTARGPVVTGAAGDSEADGESLDHRIGAEKNPNGRDSLFLYAGKSGGWLGGACISYRSSNVRRNALHDPLQAYQAMVGTDSGISPEVAMQLFNRQKSVNDLVRAQLTTLMARPELSKADRDRIDLHLQSVREFEVAAGCKLDENKELELQGASSSYDTADGNEIIKQVKLHMDVAAIAVACGYTHSVAIQIGNGNDGSNRYPDPDTGDLMADNFHYISHRRKSHGSDGEIIAGSDLLHHKVDVQFARMFKYLLDRLNAYPMLDGRPLLDHGISVWYNDNGNGPPHSSQNVPYVIAGSANGYLKQGQYIEVENGDNNPTHKKMLNTLGSAVGLTNSAGGPLDDFGDPSLPGGLLTELLA